MGLNSAPVPGSIVVCIYNDFREPEMVKARPVIIVSPRINSRPNLLTVVPISTTAPKTPKAFNVLIDLGEPLPRWGPATKVWVKCDMIATLALRRFHLLQEEDTDKRIRRAVTDQQLTEIRHGIIHSIGMGSLIDNEKKPIS